MEILKAAGVTKTYKKKAAVSNLNMTINKGDIYGFIGKNGAGKTTLIKMIVGLSTPTSGELTLFENKDLSSGRFKIGTVIEAPSFVPHLSAKQNMYIQWLLLGNKDKSIIDETLKLVGLENVGRKKVKNFSLGMKQRLGIALTLMGNPEFLILDEPVNGLDPEGIIEVRELLLKLNKEKGLTILISSHLLNELSHIATRYGMIHEGILVDEFSAEELQTRCTSSLEIKVDNVEKACDILKNQLHTENYKIIDENTIHLFDFTDNAGKVNSTLSKNDVIVNSISLTQADLEDYFMKVIGGNKND